MGLDSSTMTLGVGGVRDTEPEGIDRAIGDPDCALYLACQIGFYLAGLLGSEFLGRNVTVPTALEFLLVVRVVVLLELDEQSTSSLDAVTRDILSDAGLLDALPCALLVRDGVASPAVEQAVHPTGRPVGEVALLDERHLDPSHREIPGDATPRRAAANHDGLGVSLGPYVGVGTHDEIYCRIGLHSTDDTVLACEIDSFYETSF
jgi:hypothetical protein